MADVVGPCDDCGRIYNRSVLKSCPGCAGNTVTAPFQAPSESGSATPNIKASQLDIVMAANRTTRAVRAIYSLIMMLIVSGFIVAIWYGLEMYKNLFATVFMGLIQLACIISLLIRAEGEYAKSSR